MQALKQFGAGQSAASHIQPQAGSAAQSEAKAVKVGQRLRVHELVLLPLSMIWLYEEHVLSTQSSEAASAAANTSVATALQPRESVRAQGLPPIHTLNPKFGLIARTAKPKAAATAPAQSDSKHCPP